MQGKRREKRIIRHKRIRAVLRGSSACPRLSVFRSHRHLLAQIIDDTRGVTLAAASDRELEGKKSGSATLRAAAVGALIAKRAAEKKITRVVFDRGGYAYHGAVQALAEHARKGGLEF